MKTHPILSHESRKPEAAANWMMVVLAGLCVFGVIWALGHEDRPSRSAPVVVMAKAATPELSPEKLESQILKDFAAKVPEVAAVPEPKVATTEVKPELPLAPPPAPALMLPVAAPLPVPAPTPAPRPASYVSSTSMPLAGNPLIAEAVSVSRHLRNRGDTQGALETLRAADLQVPNQPILLAEFGQTYEAMLLPAKAEAYWKRLLKMGEMVAGEHFQVAKQFLDAPEAPTPNAEIEMPLSLGACQVVKDPTVESGERVTVRLSIKAKPGAVINPAQMDIHVFLFEDVNDGERIEQARAEAPEQAWVSAPVDWAQPEGETIEITYNLPAPTEEELRDLGKRSFHGYMVKLFYQNKLVGEQAEPISLLEFTKQPSAPAPGGLDGTLFPK